MSLCIPYGFPSQLEIRCTRCKKRALFDEPFEFFPKIKSKPRQHLPDGESEEVDLTERSYHRWGGWFVLEKFPNVLPWTTPKYGGGYSRKQGVVRCENCHAVYVHDMDWPGDAYYQWNVRGIIFWAWSTEHARVLLQFLSGTDRDASKLGCYRRSLERLPQAVISAKNRDLVVRHLRRALEAEGVELPPVAAGGSARR
jgi:hypothetical protein